MKLSEKYKSKTSELNSPAIIYNRYLNNLMFTPTYNNHKQIPWYSRLFQSISGSQITYSPNQKRNIVAYYQDKKLPSNQIHTSKYNWWNFIPKNLIQQFSKLPNLYFLIIGIFQILPYTSTTNGVPSIYIPLGIIIIGSGLKDLYEDYHRTISDNAQNQQQLIKVFRDGSQKKIISKNILVGNIIKIHRNEFIPCDGVIIYSTSKFAYVQTKNLDGETNLKRKIYLPELHYLGENTEIAHIGVQFEFPNTNMNSFNGIMEIENKKIILNNNHICLRGSTLKNTDFIYLLALYTGHQTKILKSMNKPRQKLSTLEYKLGIMIVIIFSVMILLSIICSILQFYLGTKTSMIYQYSTAEFFIVSIISWILNISNLVPISLIVTLQIVKLLQGRLLMKDSQMANSQFQTIVNCSNVLEDLGTIQCIASDKTGTLTKNNLTLRLLSDGDLIYNRQSKNIPQSVLNILPLCHEVYVSQNQIYQGLSQDQVCILDYCKIMNINLTERNQKNMIIMHGNITRNIKILKILQFSSQRKKQSIIFQEKQILYIATKGADNQMKERIKQSQKKQKIYQDLNQFAAKGYRTLVYAFKQLDKQKMQSWFQQYKITELKSQRQNIKKLQLQIQSELNIVCATGIQDQLQDDVADTVKCILKAGIRFMIISGDKPQTVLAIANNLSLGETPYLAPQNIYKQQYNIKNFLVFARCTPRQKQQIVSSLKGKTLAVGDGANDVSMLTKASIGVGISGKQGKAAIQAADFGIPQFKYLKRLLFFYGSQFNRKNSTLVLYNFYKNFVYTLPQFMFGFFSYFTGMFIYQTYLSQFYNLLYASLPIILFALFDQSYEDKILENNEFRTYEKNRSGYYFNLKAILICSIEAIVQSMVSSYICYYFLPKLFSSPNDIQFYQTTSVIFLYVVIMVNLYIIFISPLISLSVVISILVSFLAYFVTLYIFCLISNNLYGSFLKIINLKTMLLVLVCLVISFIIHLGLKILSYILQEYNKKKDLMEESVNMECDSVKLNIFEKTQNIKKNNNILDNNQVELTAF